MFVSCWIFYVKLFLFYLFGIFLFTGFFLLKRKLLYTNHQQSVAGAFLGVSYPDPTVWTQTSYWIYQLIELAFLFKQFENIISKMDSVSIGSMEVLRQSFPCQKPHNGQLYGQMYILSHSLEWKMVSYFWTPLYIFICVYCISLSEGEEE